MKICTTLALAFVGLACTSCGGGRADPAATTTPRAAETAPKPTAPNEPSERADKDEKDKNDVVKLSPDVQRRLGVAVTTATEAPLAVPLQVTGSVQPIDSQIAHVRPLARGRVQQVLVKIGDRVTRDQELALFDNMEGGELATQYEGARAELARLRVQLTTATRQAERSRKLVEIGAAPQKEYEAALGEQQEREQSVGAQESTLAGLEARLHRFGMATPSAAARSAITTIRSPFAGVVTRVTAAPGDVVDASSELFSIADISRVYVQAQVYEKDLGRVRRGQLATMTVDAYPDERFSGRVAAIGDTVDPQTRTVAVRCEVANPKALLKLDMFANIDLPTEATRSGLAVPSDSIQTIEGKHVVFVRSSESEFLVRPVQTGRVAGTLTEVTSGLKPGESVVTRGAFQVKSALLSKDLGEKDERK
jgi:cobalt-zinc-cadmium efflux system membrane fusion protein